MKSSPQYVLAFMLGIALMMALGRRDARPDDLTGVHITCPVVRDYVAQHGRAEALKMALRYKATWAQLREAYRCLQKGTR